MIIESISEVRGLPSFSGYSHGTRTHQLQALTRSSFFTGTAVFFFFFFPSSLEHVSIECHKPNSSIHDSQAEERKMSQGAEENSK